MIDNIHIEAKISPQYEFPNSPFVRYGLIFTPVYKRGYDFIEKYENEYKDLRVEIGFDKLKITGSIHKFHKGNNHSDFSRKEINQTIDEIENTFGIEASNWEIKKLEFGFNIAIQNPANTYTLLAKSFKNVEFDKMKYRNRYYGKKCLMTEYTIKFYDKSIQTKISERVEISSNIMRIEICYAKRKLPKEIKKLSDLKSENGIKSLYQQFEEIIMRIEFEEMIDFTNSNEEERKLFFCFSRF